MPLPVLICESCGEPVTSEAGRRAAAFGASFGASFGTCKVYHAACWSQHPDYSGEDAVWAMYSYTLKAASDA